MDKGGGEMAFRPARRASLNFESCTFKGVFYVQGMKRPCMIAALGVGLLVPPVSHGADASLEALAARKEIEEFIRDTNTRLKNLEESLQAQQQRIVQLEDENRNLRQDLARATANKNNNAAHDQAISKLDDKIQDVDKRRLADNKLTVEKLERLEKLISSQANEAARHVKPPPPGPVINPNADLFEYSIQSGDNLYKVVDKLKAQGIEVSREDVQKANPTVVWTKLRIGQKIIIPVSKR
jgi:vacuolar-type H+-ATPase subunit I/STV1